MRTTSSPATSPARPQASRWLKLEARLYTRLRRVADDRLAARALRSNKRPKPDHLLTGERGEDAAFFWLRERGWQITARRWRAPRGPGDLDLIAWQGTTLVVFEVKARTRRDFYPAQAQVDPAKQRILRRVARAYLRQYPDTEREQLRICFDVVAVYLLGEQDGKDDQVEFELYENAFPLHDDLPHRRQAPR